MDRIGREVRVFKNNLPGPEWARFFLRRHKELTITLCENIKRALAEVNSSVVNEYFNKLEISLENVGYQNVLNYDEINFSDIPGKSKVVAKRGSKHCDIVMDNSKTSISVMIAASASGAILPSYIVYK